MTTTDADILKQAESSVGKVLRGKWHLDAVLGVGGMASVYAATHRNGKRAAIKVLHPEAALAPTVKDRFLHEGYLANRVDHRGAVSILDDDVDEDGTVYLVMELLEGETLETRLAHSSSQVSSDELLQIVDQVLDCLCAAHDKGIVHRDLKPGNLFVTNQGQVKILDFGIARIGAKNESRGKHTTGAQTLGTPGFMPPEQARGRWNEIDARSDLWAVGAVMFAVLTGRYVHEAPTVNEQLLSAMTEPARPVRAIDGSISESLAGVVDRALAFDKAERWPDATTMRAAVREVYEELMGSPMEEAPGLSVRPGSVPSIDPAAATIDAADVSGPPRPETTARPVMGHTGGRSSRGLRLAGAALIGLAALSGALTLALGSGSENEEVAPSDETDFSVGSAAAGSPLAETASAGAPSATASAEPRSEKAEGQMDGGSRDGGAEDGGRVLPEPPLNPPPPEPAAGPNSRRAARRALPAPPKPASPSPSKPRSETRIEKPSPETIDLFSRRK